MVHIQLLDDGPILIRADEIQVGTGEEAETFSGTIALCRCGDSENKPFCDGRHQGLDIGSLPGTSITAGNQYESTGTMTPEE
jgi:CDGSH-type Zn-finger protein